jgi:hypothetical protein
VWTSAWTSTASAPRSPSSTTPVPSNAAATPQRPGRADRHPWRSAARHPVAFEAAYGWGWLAGLLDDLKLEPHLVHPTRCKQVASARLQERQGRRGDAGAAAARRPAACGVDLGRSTSAICAPCCATGPGLVRLTTSLGEPGPRRAGRPWRARARPACGPRPGGRGWPRWSSHRCRGRSWTTAVG